MNNFCGFNFSVYCNVLVPSNAKNIANTQSLKIDAIDVTLTSLVTLTHTFT